MSGHAQQSARAEAKVKKILDQVWAVDGGWPELLSILENRAIRAALVDARLRKGLTQLDVAERIGVSQATIAEFENARYPNPRLSTVRRYALAVGVVMNPRLEEIMDFEEDETEESPNQEE